MKKKINKTETITPASELDPSRIEQLLSYRDLVERWAKRIVSHEFPNKDVYHAAIVLGAIIKHSTGRVRIFDDELDGDLSGDADFSKRLLPRIEGHLNQGCSIDFALRDASERDSPIYELVKRLLRTYPDRLRVREVKHDFLVAVESLFKADVNFATGDGRSYRIEEFNSTSRLRRQAVCNFDAPETVEAINEVFDVEFEKLKDIDVGGENPEDIKFSSYGC